MANGLFLLSYSAELNIGKRRQYDTRAIPDGTLEQPDGRWAGHPRGDLCCISVFHIHVDRTEWFDRHFDCRCGVLTGD